MKETLQQVLDKIQAAGGTARKLIFEPPATEDEIRAIEQQLKQPIPPELRNILLTQSAHCELYWSLPDEYVLPKGLKDLYTGALYWNSKFLVDLNEDKDDWIKEVFPDPQDTYDKVWHHKFVFQEVDNGDYLGIDLNEDHYGKIVYLSHDDGEGHGFVMAHSFRELMVNWGKIAFIGPEDDQWLPFTEHTTSGIKPSNDKALLWRKHLHLD